MRISYLWLKDIVDFSLAPQELAEVLTMAGLEVESLEPVGPDLDGIFIGKVLEVKPHPNADRLKLCKVDLGDSTKEVVCGAPNVAQDQHIAFAGLGVTLPNGLTLESREIRGVLSEGMICSGVELGLSEDADGIMVLDSSVQVGAHLRDALGPRDWSLEIEVTLNRPDCLSHIGVAREAAATLGIPFEVPQFKVKEAGPSIGELTSITIEESELCPRYSARIIRNIKITDSPDWLRWRLEAVGLRPINNVVDVTNYVMLEMGHPMHAFDLDRLVEKRIVVRRAEAGQKFITLDEEERRLDNKMLLICDGKEGVALAGVMGGLNSEISDDTKDLLLESAYFDPVNTRRTSKLLGLSTDSSRRFERGADPEATVRALDMAAAMILDLAGGEAAKGVADVYPRKIEPKSIELRPERVTAILGIEVPTDEIKTHLSRLGCGIEGNDPIKVNVPVFRPDLEREIDLIEEVARLHGYNQIPSAEDARISLYITHSPEEVFQGRLQNALLNLGFFQVKTSPFLPNKRSEIPGYPQPVKLRNPGSDDMAFMCNGLLPGLLKVAAHNLNRSQPDLRLFEIGRGFAREGTDQTEWDVVAGLMIGSHEPQQWDRDKEAVDFLDLKGAVQNLLREISLDNADFFYYNSNEVSPYTADAVGLKVADALAGTFGQIHPSVAQSFDIDEPVFCFEFGIDALREASLNRPAYRSYPKFPPLQRDLAFTLNEEIPAGDISERIKAIGGDQLAVCELFDVYRGPQVGEGKKSIAFRLYFQSPVRTLTDEEADELIRAIVSEVEGKFGGKLRS
ncbi:phenylalanine--tRNA ligase subunit beta [candidate division LCP-89 bacterium B3_LCP]|uniref:Phenylalanine--tRNA ligase beta subunit n=1 Tax=candidate division LCP-89 bacterium B3_LCP TaxID=2012998 RepID=A0A532V5I6_UNCL8|nr:MAG: phenylalanine--tRNA ligase subunit beta [candidate division LCP-89 bacterium B3_LCP]